LEPAAPFAPPLTGTLATNPSAPNTNEQIAEGVFKMQDDNGWIPWQYRTPENHEQWLKQKRERGADPKHKQQQREYNKVYRTNPEHRQQERDRHKANRGRHLLWQSNLLHHAPPWLTDAQWEEMESRHVEKDHLTQDTGIKHSVDHIFPLCGYSKWNQLISSGLHVPFNLQVITFEENTRKDNKLPPGTGFDEPVTLDQLEILRLFYEENPQWR
jgi:hypothetical protein